MRNKITLVAMAGLFLFCCVAVPAAHAHEKCSLRTLAGTYAIYEKGSSSLLDPNPSVFPPPLLSRSLRESPRLLST